MTKPDRPLNGRWPFKCTSFDDMLVDLKIMVNGRQPESSITFSCNAESHSSMEIRRVQMDVWCFRSRCARNSPSGSRLPEVMMTTVHFPARAPQPPERALRRGGIAGRVTGRRRGCTDGGGHAYLGCHGKSLIGWLPVYAEHQRFPAPHCPLPPTRRSSPR